MKTRLVRGCSIVIVVVVNQHTVAKKSGQCDLERWERQSVIVVVVMVVWNCNAIDIQIVVLYGFGIGISQSCSLVVSYEHNTKQGSLPLC